MQDTGRLVAALAAWAALFAPPALCGGGVGRIAKVTDRTGTSTLVSDLFLVTADGTFDKVHPRGQTIVLFGDRFAVAIPMESVISMTCKADKSKNRVSGYLDDVTNCSAIRRLRGRTETISGSIWGEKLTGKSDIGGFELALSKVRELSFEAAPEEGPAEEVVLDQRLVLTDCTEVPVARLSRFASYCSSQGYLVGCETVFLRLQELPFLRGESLVTTSFADTQAIVFEAPASDLKWSNWQRTGGVSVTLKNGRQVNGTISELPIHEIQGFTGVYEKGEFFVPGPFVKAVVFGESTQGVDCKVKPPAPPARKTAAASR